METVETAVEWLDEQLQDKMFIQYGYGTGIRKIVIPIDYYMEFIKQAKAMEKEQIINAMLEEHMFDDSEYANRRYKYWQEVKQKL